MGDLNLRESLKQHFLHLKYFRNESFHQGLGDVIDVKLGSVSHFRSKIFQFFYMGQTRPLLFIFHCKVIYNTNLQTGLSIETFPGL